MKGYTRLKVTYFQLFGANGSPYQSLLFMSIFLRFNNHIEFLMQSLTIVCNMQIRIETRVIYAPSLGRLWAVWSRFDVLSTFFAGKCRCSRFCNKYPKQNLTINYNTIIVVFPFLEELPNNFQNTTRWQQKNNQQATICNQFKNILQSVFQKAN